MHKIVSFQFVEQWKFNIVHAQLHMICSNLSAHLYCVHVFNSPACICSHILEDTAHNIPDCPLYCSHKMPLRNAVTKYTWFKPKVMICGDNDNHHEKKAEIVQAVHKFINDTERC